MPQRNVIFFHAESWDGRMLGAMGHPAMAAATPNIDRIARSGVMFENTYSSHPICCPSRANMWSGRYTHHCHSWNNHKGLEPGAWSLMDALPETHTVGTFGKLDYKSGGHTQLARLSAWLAPSGVEKPVFDKDPSQRFTVADDDDLRCHTADWELVDQAVEFLKREADGDRPLFLYVSTNLVHANFHTNNYWLSKIPEEAVDIPPFDPSDHPARRYQLLTKAWRFGCDDATVRQVRRIYMAMCAEADAMVGAVYDAMHELGLADDTHFVFSSDHGEMGMEHQDWYKMSLYEPSVRVPLVMTGPSIQPGRRMSNLVSLIDLCPTFMEMMDLPTPHNLDGESLLPLAGGHTETSRDWAHASFTGCTLNTSAHMLRKEQWKYVAYAGMPSQLFDIDSDPQELTDLVGARPDVAERLDSDLRDIVDIDQTHRDWTAYCRDAFRQWREQALRGEHTDSHYALAENPSNDYWAIMDNTFTGYNQSDEDLINRWLDDD